MIEDEENVKPILMELFPHTPEARIDSIIALVQEQQPGDPREYHLESMINLLATTGDPQINDFDDEEEGAVGYANGPRPESTRYYDDLMKLFPDVNQVHLNSLLSRSNSVFDDLVDELSTGDYPKQEVDYLDVWEQLKSMLPGADPSYLKQQARKLYDKPEKIQTFIQEAIEKNNYPTMQDYIKHEKEKQEAGQYVKFDVEKFLQEIPNPEIYFSSANRTVALTGENIKQEDIDYALGFLYNHYKFLRKKHIDKVFNLYSKDIIKTCARLDRLPKAFRYPREPIQLEESCNVALLQEIAFVKHRKLIKQVVKMKDEIYREAKENARAEGCLQTCACCFDDELIPEECLFCDNNCTFCKDCVKGGTEVSIASGEINIPCLVRCGSNFSLATLKMVLTKKMFEILAHKIQLEEIKNANIDGLENCPHCDFSMVPEEGDKIFKCQNPECMKETCRECGHPAHVPLKCNEIEYDEDVRMRTYVENEMTKALVRQCYSCKKEFIKSSGCNKMTCQCGAKMCYVCGAAVVDYSHFGNNRCPLFGKSGENEELDFADLFHRIWGMRKAGVHPQAKENLSQNSTVNVEGSSRGIQSSHSENNKTELNMGDKSHILPSQNSMNARHYLNNSYVSNNGGSDYSHNSNVLRSLATEESSSDEESQNSSVSRYSVDDDDDQFDDSRSLAAGDSMSDEESQNSYVLRRSVDEDDTDDEEEQFDDSRSFATGHLDGEESQNHILRSSDDEEEQFDDSRSLASRDTMSDEESQNYVLKSSVDEDDTDDEEEEFDHSRSFASGHSGDEESQNFYDSSSLGEYDLNDEGHQYSEASDVSRSSSTENSEDNESNQDISEDSYYEDDNSDEY